MKAIIENPIKLEDDFLKNVSLLSAFNQLIDVIRFADNYDYLSMNVKLPSIQAYFKTGFGSGHMWVTCRNDENQSRILIVEF